MRANDDEQHLNILALALISLHNKINLCNYITKVFFIAQAS